MEEVELCLGCLELLLQEDMAASAVTLGEVLLSLLQRGSHSDRAIRWKAASLLGQACKAKGEYKRAARLLREAQQLRKVGKDERSGSPMKFTKPAEPTKFKGFKDMVEGGDLEPWQAAYLLEAGLKYKEAQCHIASGDDGEAIACMEGVLLFARSPQLNMLLGRTYQRSGLKRNAMNIYKAALKQTPLLTEAAEALVLLGTSQEEIWALMSKSLATLPGSPSLDDMSWVKMYLGGVAAAASNNTAKAVELFSQFSDRYHNCVLALVHLGKAYVDSDMQDKARRVFEKARLVDNLKLDLMDCYALAMRHTRHSMQLNRLAHELLSIDAQRPEGWVACALYSEARGDAEHAHKFAAKAVEFDQRHALSYVVQGSLLLAAGQPEQARVAFSSADAIHKSLHSYKGMVCALLVLKKEKHAAYVAKEAAERLPKSAAAAVLMGQVMQAHAQSRQPVGDLSKAEKAYRKALSIDPMCLEATLALSVCMLETKQYSECLQLLIGSLQHHDHEMLHARIGALYTELEQYSEALSHFHQAISLNPESVAGQAGIDRLDKLMRGIDPSDSEDGDIDTHDMEAH
ncbi:unnamed protein product [Chrysoparadoxa australica]